MVRSEAVASMKRMSDQYEYIEVASIGEDDYCIVESKDERDTLAALISIARARILATRWCEANGWILWHYLDGGRYVVKRDKT